MSGVNSGRNVGNVIFRQSEPLGSRFGDIPLTSEMINVNLPCKQQLNNCFK